MGRFIVDGDDLPHVNYPDVCPICAHAVVPQFLAATSAPDRGRVHVVDAAFKCTSGKCSRAFLATYAGESLYEPLQLVGTEPNVPVPPVVPEAVSDLSPSYAEIRTQASAAEDYGLDQVAGVGYRKALEFLVKDFAITEHPDREDDIKAQPLGAVINNYIGSGNIKECARRATWLGNDETHYVRVWEQKDISDLKRVLRLTESWIEDHLTTARLLEDMPEPAAKKK